jgi:hypothetical protein
MSKCEKCLSHNVCKWWANGDGHNLNCTDEVVCPEYKDKSLFVELPCRCKDCEHYCANYCTRDIKGRTNMFYMNENDYCSYAEKKLQEMG